MKKSELRKIIRELLVSEVFDTKKELEWNSDEEGYEWDEGDSPDFNATFSGPNNRPYAIYMQSLFFLDLPDEAMEFAGEVMSEEVFDDFFESGYHVEFTDIGEGSEITGLGGSKTASVFGIVVNAVMDKIRKENIKYIFFSAKEGSRRALYSKMAPLLARKLGWKGQANNGEFYFLSKDPLK